MFYVYATLLYRSNIITTKETKPRELLKKHKPVIRPTVWLTECGFLFYIQDQFKKKIKSQIKILLFFVDPSGCLNKSIQTILNIIL